MFPIHERNVDLIPSMIERIKDMMLTNRLVGILRISDPIPSTKLIEGDCRVTRCNCVAVSLVQLLGISSTGT